MQENSESLPKVEYPEGFDEQDAYFMPSRGYISGLIVVTPDGSRYPVYFTDLTRLTQDFEAYIDSGDSFYAEQRMIIVKEVTIENIENAVASLWRQGWFK